ncbi:hypothetical protein GCM10027089_59050 [Nocardia thraciensis]
MGGGDEMNSVGYEIVNPGPAGETASLSWFDLPADLDADRNVEVQEPTNMWLIVVRGHLCRNEVADCHLAQQVVLRLGSGT